MTYSLSTSLIINISLMCLIAIILTKVPFVKKMMAEGSSKLSSKLELAVIFGAFCIFSTCTGVRVNGAIQNTRVLGALVGGLLGGPVVGVGAALIGAVHRFLYDIHGFTSVACVISTLFEGVLGSVVWVVYKKKNLKHNPISLFLITAGAECCQMGIILLLAKPFQAAVELVSVIAFPMIVYNALGMVLFFSIFEEVFTRQDLLAAEKIRLALNIADQCIPYIRLEEPTQEDYNKIAEIIEEYSRCKGVLMLDGRECGALNATDLSAPPELVAEIRRTGKEAHCFVGEKWDKNYPMLGKYTALGVTLTKGTEVWMYLILFMPRHIRAIETEITFLQGLAKFFSTNLELAEIAKQKKLREQAEFRALQSQINPHFLFNALNTISVFCREKPDEARELILALSLYFRNTLDQSNRLMVPVEQEIENVEAYLKLERARFGERLTVHIDVEETEYTVPPLILQPIVENAVKHGAMKRESGEVTITGFWQGEEYVIQVEDNGPGIGADMLKAFKDRDISGKHGLLNVDARLRSNYGEGNGLEIVTGENGTKISMRIQRQTIL